MSRELLFSEVSLEMDDMDKAIPLGSAKREELIRWAAMLLVNVEQLDKISIADTARPRCAAPEEEKIAELKTLARSLANVHNEAVLVLPEGWVRTDATGKKCPNQMGCCILASVATSEEVSHAAFTVQPQSREGA